MLTFEEFFFKKKIDIAQFKIAEPALFAEFGKHYPLMGEKSFDHTKKYWFNNLRRAYPLQQKPKPHAVQAEAISQMAIQGIAVAAAQNLNEAIERPKFKEDNLPDLVEENVPEQDVSLAEIEKTIIEDKPEFDIPKPAFKPRFNAKNIKKPEVAVEPENKNLEPSTEPKPATENTQPATEPTTKPAFKPRFNMQNIKKEPVKTVSLNVKPETGTKESEPETENPEPKAGEAKPVYKPRFQMKNIPKPETGNPPPETEV